MHCITKIVKFVLTKDPLKRRLFVITGLCFPLLSAHRVQPREL